jgi:putative component of membrane protein insertase Oxa1/YidC/SpoIIIJ protein YidD
VSKLIFVIIQLYYKFYPEDSRRVCLHYESCSKYVYRIANERGGIKAIIAYYSRYKSCNAKYKVCVTDDGNIFIKTKNGLILKENQINPFVLKGIKTTSQ